MKEALNVILGLYLSCAVFSGLAFLALMISLVQGYHWTGMAGALLFLLSFVFELLVYGAIINQVSFRVFDPWDVLLRSLAAIHFVVLVIAIALSFVYLLLVRWW